ncbi:toxin-antitoxin system YwqK family antitoxin [Namhaeicola litoreus]|uniref:Toxin-antitoxin system YwqK family antitoxin n=1 Tax=Namhaeicola litoreus TaxID=1052145 RepID=A0ABW3Y229_9FLAO
MKEKIKIVFSLFFLLISCYPLLAQNEVNKLNKDGEREGVWEKYYDNNRLRYRGTFKNGKEVGTFKYYSAASSEHPVIIKEFDSNSDIADVKFYTEAGVLESEGKMKGKDRIGKWTFYHTDGKSVMSEENYVNGKLEGSYKTFFQDGSPTEIANYKNGLLDGNYKKYAIKGHLIYDFNYKNGKLNGLATYYSRRTGDLIKKGPFKDDERVGTWENYVDGELVSTEQPAIKPKKED